MYANKNQIKIIRAILAKHGQTDNKEDIILSATSDRTTHISKMYYNEAARLIIALKQADPVEQCAQKMRRKIISMAHEMGWRYLTKEGIFKADMRRIDNWASKYGYLHKHLGSYTYSELPALITQFETVYQSFLKGI